MASTGTGTSGNPAGLLRAELQAAETALREVENFRTLEYRRLKASLQDELNSLRAFEERFSQQAADLAKMQKVIQHLRDLPSDPDVQAFNIQLEVDAQGAKILRFTQQIKELEMEKARRAQLMGRLDAALIKLKEDKGVLASEVGRFKNEMWKSRQEEEQLRKEFEQIDRDLSWSDLALWREFRGLGEADDDFEEFADELNEQEKEKDGLPTSFKNLH